MEGYSLGNYKKKLEKIFSRHPSVQAAPFGEAYKPGLEGMREFARILGDPQDSFHSIHVAGTNGKGSVANMLASALAAAGLKVGLYTPPHIVDFRERMRIACPPADEGPAGAAGRNPSVELVPREYVWSFLCDREADIEALGLSFFEITTGMAFRWFADEKVDVAVIEVGLGGRLDSTNIITPDLSVVTSIALDHCELLGHTLQEVASEKAGIFKKGVPAIVGEALAQARPVFESKAEDAGCASLTFAEDSEPGLWHLSERILGRMDLRGKYQSRNLRTVLSAVDILKGIPSYGGLCDDGRTVEAIENTARRMEFHGRWERLCQQPFIIADIGHNPAALALNFAQLEEMVAQGDCSSLIIVYAVMADKDLDGIMPLMPVNATYIFTAPQTRRALEGKELLRRYLAFCDSAGRPKNRVYEADSARQALTMAINLAKQTARKPSSASQKLAIPLIYVGGSTYLVSEAVQILKSLQGF